MAVPQINTVENPIINSPYAEPTHYWYIEANKSPQKRAGRRPASYFFRVPERAARGRKGKAQDDFFEEESKGEEYLLDLANLLRLRVHEWRGGGCFHDTTETTRL